MSIEKTNSLRDVLATLTQRELLDESSVARITKYVAGVSQERNEPWFVKMLLAVGAWVSALFFVACLAVAQWIDFDWTSLLSWGLAFLTVAVVVRRVTDHVFATQLALALSSVAHMLILTAATDWAGPWDETTFVALTAAFMCAVLYVAYPDTLHRFLSCLLASSCLTVAIVDTRAWPLLHLALLFKVVTLGLVFVYRPGVLAMRPLGYAMAFSLLTDLVLVVMPHHILAAVWWPANVILTIALLCLYRWIAGGWGQLRNEPLLLATVATVCLATFTTPGILAALGLMILGYSRDDRYLMGIGALFFPIFIVVFYYEWETSLLVKSWIMAGSGAVLLAARGVLSLRGWTKEAT